MVSNGQLFKKSDFFTIRDQDRAACAETGRFRDSQNELRCKNNGIGGGNRAAGAETGCFRDLQNELRCRNNGIGEETARRARKLGVLGNRKTNYVVKTTELGRKPRGMRGVLIFRSTAEKMGQAAACWRAKSADGGGNRRTSAKKNTRGRCGQQMESCAGGGTLSKKCAKNANWTGAAALSPQRRGYAAKIMRRKNARRKFGKRASGESHYRNPCGIIRNIW